MPNWVEVDHFAHCKRCGARDVAWQQTISGRWYLVTARRRPDGVIEADRIGWHSCHTSYTPPFNDAAPRSRVTGTTEELRWMQAIIEAGFRALARKHHPDCGGNTIDMQNLNVAVEKLRRMGSA